MLRLLLSGQVAAVWYVLLVFCLPMITLAGFGLLYLWQNHWLIPVTMGWLLVTLAAYAAFRLWPEHRKRQPAEQDAAHTDSTPETDDSLLKNLPMGLEERPYWTRTDREVWQRSVAAVEEMLAEKPTWKALPELALELLTCVSEQYDGPRSKSAAPFGFKLRKAADATYRFTLPEMLLVLSITSSRYRQLLLANVPFADRLKLSAILSLYDRQDQIITGVGWFNTVRRTARLANPLAALAAELRDQFTNRIFTTLSDKVQNNLKRLLLQELVQVGMDLYSGRLKSSDEELSVYQSSVYTEDLSAKALPVEPLRVVLLGQVSAGKSSLVNALVDVLEAETDILPNTNRSTVHALYLPEELGDTTPTTEENKAVRADVHLIDTVGLVDESASMEATVNTAQQADLLIWVTRATQPARAPEAQVHKALMQRYDNDPALRPPPMLLVVSHIDQLSPKAEWKPPYDLTSDEPKALNIKHAIDSCVRQIGLHELTPAIPVALAQQHESYNIEALIAQILLLRSDASQTQLNRRRLERDMNAGGWRERWEQASKFGTVSGKLITRSVLGK